MCNDLLINVTYTVVPMSERPYNLRSVFPFPGIYDQTHHFLKTDSCKVMICICVSFFICSIFYIRRKYTVG